jgi:hypothetical protein
MQNGCGTPQVSTKGIAMQAADRHRRTQRAPKKRPQHYSYDTNLDEPGELLQQEAVDIEEETAGEDSESIEQLDREEKSPPAFEE